MKSFRKFVSESLEQKDFEYQEVAKMLLSNDPYESYYARENIQFVYSPEEKKRIAEILIGVVTSQSKAGQINVSNPYEILILLEESELADLLDFPGSPFENQFIIKEQTSAKTFSQLFEYQNITLVNVEITDDLLKGLTSVKMLDLDGEKFLDRSKKNIVVKNISKNTFADCTSLRKVTISGYEIEKISENIFEKCPELLSFSIESGKVNEINRDAFTSNTIKEIILYESEIENIADGTFLNCAKLENLNLSKNRLTKIPTQLPNTIKELHLSHNKIEGIDPGIFSNLKNLDHLDLSSNPIKTIDKNSFSGLSNLSSLLLAYLSNDIKIEPGAFLKLEKLKEIDLIGTELSVAEADRLESELPDSTEVIYELPF